MRSLLVALLFLVLAGAAGCVRMPGGVAPSNLPLAPGSYVELGPVDADDCSIRLLMLLPVTGGNHTSDAIAEAMAERPMTDALVNISVDRVTKLFILWSQTCTEVRATAVKIR